MDHLQEYFDGTKLYGDDFSLVEIEQWFEDERNAYAELVGFHASGEGYAYHAINRFYGYDRIGKGTFPRVLSLGGSDGEELRPIVGQIREITIIEPAEAFRKAELCGVPIRSVSPQSNGVLPFPPASFDLITCFGTLHHIPNVSSVMGELYRCLVPSGYALIREPIISMGDWRKPRPGLTKRERGIPWSLFRAIAVNAGFTVLHEFPVMYSVSYHLCPFLPRPVLASQIGMMVDFGFNFLFSRHYRYHAERWVDKFRPTALFLVLRKGTS